MGNGGARMRARDGVPEAAHVPATAEAKLGEFSSSTAKFTTFSKNVFGSAKACPRVRFINLYESMRFLFTNLLKFIKFSS